MATNSADIATQTSTDGETKNVDPAPLPAPTTSEPATVTQAVPSPTRPDTHVEVHKGTLGWILTLAHDVENGVEGAEKRLAAIVKKVFHVK
jgi:hypothetical protein